ncbi:MAG TPA: signal recognition particle protein [Armatimonadota bacterium]|jgi:signal recognition particle subunit SRP54
MFDALTDKLQQAFKRLSSKGKLGPKEVREGLKEIRVALLEADVAYDVVKDFVNKVQQKSLGEDILRGLNPAQQIVKIVHEQLVELLGEEAAKIKMASDPPTVIVLAGLQGSGKTTTAGKLAARLLREGHRPLLVATDVYRPAAIDQLQQIGAQIGVPVFAMGDQHNPVDIAKAAVLAARSKGQDIAIIDTAGRLHLDEAMMNEVQEIEGAFAQTETLLVIDSMTGQDAVNVAKEFGSRLHLDGLILTKLDSDARGGAALSARAVTGLPIKFVGVSERPDGLDVFYPDRMAQRILGMGDVLTLVEKAQQAITADEAAKLQEKLFSNKFNLEDFRDHLKKVRGMGPLDQLMKMIPGMGNMAGMGDMAVDEKELDRVEAVINSMTAHERRDPELLNASRKRRVAAGSGLAVQDVNIVLKEFRQLAQLMESMGKGKPMNIGGMRLRPGR